MKSLLVSLLFAAIACVVVAIVLQQRNATALQAAHLQHTREIETLRDEAEALKKKLAEADRERERMKADATEVHKLRGEVSNLRKSNEALGKNLSGAQATATPKPEAAAESATPAEIPASFSNYSEMAQFAAGLRSKINNGQITPQEQAWLQQMKPELEKLEANPENFAAFQASMIQATTGIADPEKLEQIQRTIQKVYESAVNRGLNLQSRPEDDAAWIQQRHQLDRRGTTAVQGLLSEEERAAFDRSFLGVMGVDLGTGVDKTLYPPGFLGDPVPVAK